MRHGYRFILSVLMVIVGAGTGCHAVLPGLEEACTEDPMVRDCRTEGCATAYECVSYCLEHFPEGAGGEAPPDSGMGSWCDDERLPDDYGDFCSGSQDVVGCQAWCEAHEGACEDGGDGDADGDGDGDADGDGDIDADGDADSDGDSDGDGDGDGDGEEDSAFCGDETCDSGESACDCPGDCEAACGDECCTHAESAASCPGDCPAGCGDGACTHDETVATCPGDCPASCGDGSCSHEENACTCDDDCGSVCGDGCCTHDEFAGSCASDCPASCSDGLCTHDENACTCQDDCGADCGDGCCTHAESAATCPDDCPAFCGDSFCTHDEWACICRIDCGPVCGDDCCSHDEDACTCEDDCGAVCGDACCTHAESARLCPSDCPAVCGDGFCTHDESAATCWPDCPAVCGDGVITHDEDCEGDASRGCDTDCRTIGSQACIDCSWGPCIPPIEVCNGADDDCDGETDNGFECITGVEYDCSTTCGSSSTWVCGPTCEWPVSCEPDPVEICDNGEDDDCDGYVVRVIGQPLTADVRITSRTGTSTVPSVVWTGTEYAVAWADDRGVGNWDIYFARLAGDGEMVGTEVRVTTDAGASTFPSLVWTGTGFGVAWQDSRDGNDNIYFARLDEEGAKIGTDQRILATPGGSAVPSLVWTGSVFGVAWQEYIDGNWEIYFARLNVVGVRIGSEMRITASPRDSDNPSLVWTGEVYGVAWQDYRDSNWEIYFSRINAEGFEMSTDVRVTDASLESVFPTLVWNGREYGLAWQDSRVGNQEIYFTRLTSVGVKLGSDVRVTAAAGGSASPSLAWTGSEYGVVWQDYRDSNWEIYFTRLTATGEEVGTDVRITAALQASNSPSLVWTSDGYGVAWVDNRDGNDEIYFSRLGVCVSE